MQWEKILYSGLFAAISVVSPFSSSSIASDSSLIVNDVTNINPIKVSKIVQPKSIDELIDAMKSARGSISIGGGRYSMGGQTATENTLQIDMRRYNKIIRLDPIARTITVQAGIRWRDIQEVIDPYDLSIRIMQTYSNFTVGGSLSVNAHGRYIGEGPIIRSVLSIKIVLASGEEITASPTEHSDIFYAAIGGYGGIGIITEATLHLVPNERIRRENVTMPVAKYQDFFFKNIRDDPKTVLHNADLYPPHYKEVRLETWRKTDHPLTVHARLIPQKMPYFLLPHMISLVSSIPFGSDLRAHVLDPIRDGREAVVLRNYEASYDVGQLEPSTPRVLFTYVLQEYFVPVDAFDLFLPRMAKVLQGNEVNVVNISIRHALPDTGSFLAWAPQEVFSFVIYYKQSTSKKSQEQVASWTRRLIDEAISVGGRHYMPYQIHGTAHQFKKAYPGYKAFFSIKKMVDPRNLFRNKLWDAYYQ
jgi:FAD/FMN-containing dehydrogenase